jgi:hypothetical protein
MTELDFTLPPFTQNHGARIVGEMRLKRVGRVRLFIKVILEKLFTQKTSSRWILVEENEKRHQLFVAQNIL